MPRKKKQISENKQKKQIVIELTPRRSNKEDEEIEKHDEDSINFQDFDQPIIRRPRRTRIVNPSLEIRPVTSQIDTLEEELEDTPSNSNNNNQPVLYNAPSYGAGVQGYSSNISYAAVPGANSPEQDMSGGMIKTTQNEQFDFKRWRDSNIEMGPQNPNQMDNYVTTGDRLNEDRSLPPFKRDKRPF